MSENTKNQYFTLLESVNESNQNVLKSNTVMIESIKKLIEFLNESGILAENVEDLFKQKEEDLQRVIDTIPKSIDAGLSGEARESINRLEDKMNSFGKFVKYVFFSLAISFAILFSSAYFSYRWFGESIRTKTEIRAGIFEEITKNGDKIVEKKEFEKDLSDIEAMKAWLNNHPKEANEFMKFKAGYDARNNEK